MKMYIYFNYSRHYSLQLHYYSKPQLITIMYIQLHMIKHINRQFVVLHTCTETLFHTQHSEMHNKSLDAPITTKDNLYLTFSDKKRALQMRAFLTIVSVQCAHFISFHHNFHRFFSLAVASGMP